MKQTLRQYPTVPWTKLVGQIVEALVCPTLSRSTAVMTLHPKRSPNPTIESLDLGEISSMTLGARKQQLGQFYGGRRTWAANRKDRSASTSRSISNSSSFRISGSRTVDLAAVRCSERMRSTVELNDVDAPAAGVMDRLPNGESDRGEDLLRGLGLPSGDWSCEKRDDSPFGVLVPVSTGLRVRCSASEAALRRRLVVPRAFVEPERAEQTMATLCWSRYCLEIHEMSMPYKDRGLEARYPQCSKACVLGPRTITM
jgi:hypothetical protein